MKNAIIVMLLAGSSLQTGIAMAECSKDLSAKEAIDCINYQGASAGYLNYKDVGDKYTEDQAKDSDENGNNDKTEFASMKTKE